MIRHTWTIWTETMFQIRQHCALLFSLRTTDVPCPHLLLRTNRRFSRINEQIDKMVTYHVVRLRELSQYVHQFNGKSMALSLFLALLINTQSVVVSAHDISAYTRTSSLSVFNIMHRQLLWEYWMSRCVGIEKISVPWQRQIPLKKFVLASREIVLIPYMQIGTA